MNLIVCIDDKGGYSFANRRQSKDKVLLENMLQYVGNNKLFVNEYSAKLFTVKPDYLVVCENPLQECGDNDFCFVENIDLENINVNKIIIYRWNRSYPHDKKIPYNLLDNKRLVSSIDFSGNSHEKITEEVFE